LAYPTVPNADYSYQQFQQAQQDNDFPGTELDNDLANLINALQEVRDYLELIGTSEGKVRASAVPNLSAEIEAALVDLNTAIATAEALLSQVEATASQAEAEAGTDNFKRMTPLRTKQAIQLRVRSVTDFGIAKDGTGNSLATVTQLNEDVASGDVPNLYWPPGDYLFDDGAIDFNEAPNGLTLWGEGRELTEITLADGAGQNAFVIRNTDYIHVRGIKFRSTAPAADYQHTFQLMNCNYSVTEWCEFDGAGGYGWGCYEDTVANPDVEAVCNYNTVRHNIIRDASQYGVQHFPKVRSSGFWCHDNLLINCGHNAQGLVVPTAILPSAIKGGQATDNSYVYNNVIFAAENAAGLDYGNFEDLWSDNNTVYNCEQQFMAISIGEHPSLLPYVASHRRLVSRGDRFIMEPGAGTRVVPAITISQDATTSCDLVRIERPYIEGDNYTNSILANPSGTLPRVEIIEPTIVGDFPAASIVIWANCDENSGDITGLIIKDPTIIHTGATARSVLRAIQLQSCDDARLLGGYFKDMGENVLDIRTSPRAFVKGATFDGYNRVNTAGVAAIAITDTIANEYFVEDCSLLENDGNPKGLVSASTATPEIHLGNNLLPVGVSEYLGTTNVVRNTPGVQTTGTLTTAPTSGTGTLTTASMSMKWTKLGRLVHFDANITITTRGTGTGNLILALPFTPAEQFTAMGRQNSAGFEVVAISSLSTLLVRKTDETTALTADGITLTVSGDYVTAA
jgi:hypothetical protein